jgi:hypothetical protein
MKVRTNRRRLGFNGERNGFRLPLCIDSGARGTLRHVAASLAHQPLPLAADMQD